MQNKGWNKCDVGQMSDGQDFLDTSLGFTLLKRGPMKRWCVPVLQVFGHNPIISNLCAPPRNSDQWISLKDK